MAAVGEAAEVVRGGDARDRGVGRGEGEGADDALVAVRPEHAELGVELLLAAQCQLDSFVATLAVVGVQPRLPGLVGAAKRLAGDPVEGEHLLVPGERVVEHVVVPDADATGARGKREAGRGLRQFLLHQQAHGAPQIARLSAAQHAHQSAPSHPHASSLTSSPLSSLSAANGTHMVNAPSEGRAYRPLGMPRG